MMKNDYTLPSLASAARRPESTVRKEEYILAEKYHGLGQGKTYFIRTHGCQANQRDSETMAGLLQEMGYRESADSETADLILINTCAVRQNAEEKVFGEIGALKRLKKARPELLIGVAGCMAQEEIAVKTIIEKYPQVDLIFGTHNITSLPQLLYEATRSQKRQVEVLSEMMEVSENVPVRRFQKHKAWVNIMYGCDKFCTYCIVPYTRGRERSRYLEDIVAELKELKEEGYKEVTLLGQNVNAYGKDLNRGYGFGELLKAAAETAIPRIRFMTSHPWDFDDSMLEAMREHPNIMPYLHLPLQSGSDAILKTMNRRYTAEEYRRLVDKIRELLPDYALTTDIIVGFPNETDEDFAATLSMVDYCQYDNAYTFIYSPRIGTPAARMNDSISQEVKEQRLQLLNEKIAGYANKNNQKFLGKEVEVLVDGLSKRNSNVYSGYSRENKLVNFTAEKVAIGDLIKVRITQVMSFSLNGEAIEK